mmetsp:Transcript_12604/g.27874  ORF Transcript_12604/g.27874 Transcript_12604/m.27874 type:complete len:132 (-) Transcript_12604:2010-2405(-)
MPKKYSNISITFFSVSTETWMYTFLSLFVETRGIVNNIEIFFLHTFVASENQQRHSSLVCQQSPEKIHTQVQFHRTVPDGTFLFRDASHDHKFRWRRCRKKFYIQKNELLKGTEVIRQSKRMYSVCSIYQT